MTTSCLVLYSFLRACVRVIGCVLAADFITGLMHWLEDSYGREDWPVVGQAVIAHNREHHARPRSFLAHGVWRSIDLQVGIALPALGALWLAGWLTPCAALVVALLVAANVVHRWAHATPAENGRIITWLQRLRLVQDRRHHGLHHGRGPGRHYCAITPWLDPILDRMGFWRSLERAVQALTGVAPLAAA
jgi:hypothetical protein